MRVFLTEAAWEALRKLARVHVHREGTPAIRWDALAQLVACGFANRHAITEEGLKALAEYQCFIVGTYVTQHGGRRRFTYVANWTDGENGVSWNAEIRDERSVSTVFGSSVIGPSMRDSKFVRQLVEQSIEDRALS